MIDEANWKDQPSGLYALFSKAVLEHWKKVENFNLLYILYQNILKYIKIGKQIIAADIIWHCTLPSLSQQNRYSNPNLNIHNKLFTV